MPLRRVGGAAADLATAGPGRPQGGIPERSRSGRATAVVLDEQELSDPVRVPRMLARRPWPGSAERSAPTYTSTSRRSGKTRKRSGKGEDGEEDHEKGLAVVVV